jgi:hypothetical protein
VVEHRLGQQLLELGVLVLQSLQPPGVGNLQAAILGLPFAKRGAADAVLPAHIGRRRPRLLFTQDPDDLLFREPSWLHGPSPSRGDGLYSFLEELAGLRPPEYAFKDGYLAGWRWMRRNNGVPAIPACLIADGEADYRSGIMRGVRDACDPPEGRRSWKTMKAF